MVVFRPSPAREQPPLDSQPYDRWILPDGFVKAEFHRLPDGFLLRFPGEADFAITPESASVTGWPVPGTDPAHFRSLFDNAVLPLLGDHHGGLFLHGSAVAIDGRAVAFLGHSGAGKSTLAGAFARAGHPFLTEDVIELLPEGGRYLVQPKPTGVRLCVDSAAWLLGEDGIDPDSSGKIDIAGTALPFHDRPAPLAAIILLGGEPDGEPAIAPLAPATTVPSLLPHSFVLDVEDKPRLRGHFGRIGALCDALPFYRVDYDRDYARLPAVLVAIIAAVTEGKAVHD